MYNTISADETCSSGAVQIAADYSNNGKTDWHLPSYDELTYLYVRRTTVGGFASADYWSSSERFNVSTWSLGFGTGSWTSLNKDQTLRVRVVRAF
jgi:hypothetical protein